MSNWKHKVAEIAQRNRQEIVKAKLSRREMVRLGLLTAGGTLVVKQGLSSRAFAQASPTLTDPDATLAHNPASPPVRPWVQPMPRLTVKTPVAPQDMEYGPPDGTTPIDGATKRIPHQYFSYTPPTDGGPIGTYGASPANPTYNFAPKKFYELNVAESFIQVHPDYAPTRFFAFDGQVPGPLFKAKYGKPVLVRFKNKLPSVNIPQNFGISEVTTHLHNGHTPSESDGNPVNFFNSINDPNAVNPLGFKDQHYPNVYAGFTDPQYGPTGNPNEALASLWYHDHHLDFTAQNVYKGMFGCYNLFDDLDTGDRGTGLKLPAEDYDIPIFFHDILFDKDCQTVFDLFNLDGILGDRFLANGVIQPYLNVEKRRYRFRLYAPGPSRWWEWSIWDGTNMLPFWQICTDGNLLPNAVQVTSVRIAVAERVDIIVDFSKIKSNRIYFVNRAEQVNGRGPTGKTLTPGTPVLQVNLTGPTLPLTGLGADESADPSVGAQGVVGMKLRDLPDMNFAALNALAAKAKPRTWRFERGSGGWMVNGKFFDENIIDASISRGQAETWTIQNPGGSWRHPVHIHFEEHRMLSRNGGTPVKPNTQLNGAIDYSRRDVINLQTNDETKLFMRFRDMKGRYVMHCHNVVHEDHAMMIRWDITD